MEILVKARLMAEHWAFIVITSDNSLPNVSRFANGNFTSVSLEEASRRLEAYAGIKVEENEMQAFTTVRTIRNKMVHFFHESQTDKKKQKETIAKAQLVAWYYLHNLLNNKWANVFEKWSKDFEKIHDSLKQYHEFLMQIYKEKKKDIENLKKKGSHITVCPSCTFETQKHAKKEGVFYDSECLVCGLKEKSLQAICPDCSERIFFKGEGLSSCDKCREPLDHFFLKEYLINEGAVNSNIIDEEYLCISGNCSICGRHHTIVYESASRNYLCLKCFETFTSVQECQDCDEPIAGDTEHSYSAGCSNCVRG